MKTALFPLAIAAFALSGCMTNETPDGGGRPGSLTAQELFEIHEQRGAEFDAAEEETAQGGVTLPSSLDATYSGVAMLGYHYSHTAPFEVMIGEMKLDAKIDPNGADTINGNLSNFYAASGLTMDEAVGVLDGFPDDMPAQDKADLIASFDRDVTGSLDLTGTIANGGNEFPLNINGTLVDGSTNVVVGGQVQAGFHGNSAQAIGISGNSDVGTLILDPGTFVEGGIFGFAMKQ
ncbi:MAG: hypothetical protein CR993_01140 [Rhodobacterales bacterium]|nr:MAG: hypothetical protein CR993_01140 [Rhodobacterales bacterium]